METIKVNMNPNPLDVQTIHASQNDGEARQWEFELHNNGELIDTSDVKEQLVFKAYKGGTEQILPENGAVPVTAPFVGDIKYSDAMRNDQEFLYRQSPTEEDGNAKITDIKGNTLNWNQLVQNGNFVDTSSWSFTAGTLTVSNNIGTFKATAQYQSVSKGWLSNAIPQGHKLLCVATLKSYTANNTRFIVRDTENGVTSNIDHIILSTTKQTYSIIHTRSSGTSGMQLLFQDDNSSGWGNIEISNVMLFDLTQMGLDSITSVDEFTSLFPLSYYAYNQGTLLSFNGNGIKTTGKNLLPTDLRMTNLYGLNDDKSIYQFNTSSAPFQWLYENSVFRATLPSGNYKVGFIAKQKSTSTSAGLNLIDSNNNFIVSRVGSLNNLERGEYSFSLTKTTDLGLCVKLYDGVWWLYIIDAQNEMATYEPYTESTLSLPISTYFSNGMKSAGSVYDELAETKAINRLIKTVVDGTNKTASYYGVYQTHQLFYADLFATTYADFSNMANLISNHYSTSTSVEMSDKYIRYQAVDNQPNIGRIYWNDDRYTSASAMNTALQSDPLEIISLAQTPTETSLTTASLVTENAEIPLSNEDGVLIGKCTEELSSQPGFFDAKIKLTDGDGTCYSNKIQLHIERKPS